MLFSMSWLNGMLPVVFPLIASYNIMGISKINVDLFKPVIRTVSLFNFFVTV